MVESHIEIFKKSSAKVNNLTVVGRRANETYLYVYTTMFKGIRLQRYMVLTFKYSG